MNAPRRPAAAMILEPWGYDRIYGDGLRRELAEFAHFAHAEPFLPRSADADRRRAALAKAEVLVSGWGGPRLDDAFLADAPRLEVLLYGAGSVKNIMTDAAWNRGVRVSTAAAANAVPVAEFALSQVLFALKFGWQHVARTRAGRWETIDGVPGVAAGSTIGLVSLGLIARRLVELLRPFEVDVIAYDPFVPADEVRALGVRLASLAEVFSQSHVVSVHAPLLDATRGMIGGDLVRAMRQNATLLNTSRGGVLDQPSVVAALRDRPDVAAVLDVTDPHEPPPAGSPLFALPNVVLTPHVAGSMGGECRRMGRLVLSELRRYAAGQPLQHALTCDRAATTA